MHIDLASSNYVATRSSDLPLIVLKSAQDLLTDEPLVWLEGLELADESRLNANVSLLYCQR